MTQELSRRTFLRGGVAAAATAAVASLAGCNNQPAPTDPSKPAEITEGASFAERPAEGSGSHPVDFGAARSGADPIPPVEPPAAWDGEADVVVVGTGLGGVSASLYAVEHGLKVITIEKSSVTGGASRHASMVLCHHGGTKGQNELGFKNVWGIDFDPDDPESVKDVTAKYLEAYDYSPDYKLMARQVSDGPKWIDWLGTQKNLDFVPVTYSPRRFRDKVHADSGNNDILGFDNMFNVLTQDMIDLGVDLHLSCAAAALVVEDGKVIGVQATENGATKYFKGAKGVILACGGMGYNQDLLEKYIPLAYMGCANGGPMPSHTGEGIRMGLGVDADMSGFGSFSSWQGALDEYWGEGGTGEWWSYMWKPINYYAYLPFLSVTKAGTRLPLYIGGASGKYMDRFDGLPFNSGMGQTVAAYISAGDHRRYMVFDSRHFDHFSEEWANNIMAYYNPQTICYTGLSEEAAKWVPESFEADFNECVANGAIKKADTIAELEQICGFEAGVLQAAVDKWNFDIDNGKDSELICPMPVEWMTYVKHPPYYCACWGGNLGKTLCGLTVNDKMQVMSKKQTVIPGLYACWSTAGGFTGAGDMSDYGACTPMGSVGASGASGFVAARAILGEYDA